MCQQFWHEGKNCLPFMISCQTAEGIIHINNNTMFNENDKRSLTIVFNKIAGQETFICQ